MTEKELVEQGYEFRCRSTRKYGACVTLCGNGSQLLGVFYHASARFAMKAACNAATVNLVSRRLA